jgi:hypothetical protein
MRRALTGRVGPYNGRLYGENLDSFMQITINAFATLEEIAEWLTPFTKKTPLYFVLEVYFPKKRFIPISRWEQFVDKARTLKANELWIDLVPIPTSRGKLDPKYKNRERFSINLPEMTKSGFREGWFGTVATKEKHLKVWRSIIRAIRKNTTGGMWIWNDVMKTKGFWDRSRYSPKIAELHAKGLRLRPFAGGNEVFISEPNVDGDPVGG